VVSATCYCDFAVIFLALFSCISVLFLSSVSLYQAEIYFLAIQQLIPVNVPTKFLYYVQVRYMIKGCFGITYFLTAESWKCLRCFSAVTTMRSPCT
jgi:hypothetical protein